MKIICISGKAGAGKDATANIMENILKLSGKCVKTTHYADLLKYMCKSFFNWDGNKDERGRTMLQKVGTDIVRAYDPDFWVRFVRDVLVIFDGYWDYVLIPDTRFPNEIGVLKRENFNVVHVHVDRPGMDQLLTEEQLAHSSENSLKDVHVDYTITNDGDLTDLALKVAGLIAKLEGKKINDDSGMAWN